MANSFSIRGQYQSNIEQGLAKDKAAFAGLGTAANQHLGTVGTSFGKVGTAASKMSGALSHAKGAVGGLLTGPLGMIGLAGGAIGLEKAITGVIGASRDYGSSMTLLQTQTGASAGEVKKMSGAVLDLAKSLPQGPNELAKGLYHIESAGMRGARALDVLKIAAQGAATGGADLESVTNALVGVEQSGIKGAEDLGVAMGTLNGIIGAGNMRMQDLADAMSSGIAATAKTFGASLQSVGAALATLTDEGIPAIDAATRLRMTINLLGAPSSKARNLFKDIGLSATDLANAMRGPNGLVGAVTMLHGAMAKAGMIDASGINTQGAQFLSGAFGGGRSSSAIMTLIGNMDLVDKKFAAVNAGAKGFGDAVTVATQTAGWKFATFQSKVEVLAVRLGNVLLPVAADIADSLGKILGDPSTEASLVGGLTAAVAVGKDLGAVLGTVFGGLMTAWNAIPGPLQQLLVGGEILGKTSKFLFGIDFSPTALGSKIASGMVAALGKSLAMSTAEGVEKGLVASALGKAFVQPVFVTNWAMMSGGGAVGAVEGAAGSGLAVLGGMSLTAAVTMIAGIVIPLAAIYIATQVLPSDPTRNTARTGGSPTIGYGTTGTGATGATAGGGAGAFKKGTGATGPMAGTGLPVTVQGGAGGPTVNASTGFVTSGTSPTVNAQTGFVTGGLWRSGVKEGVQGGVTNVVKALDTLHADLQTQLGVLKTSKDPAAIAAAAQALTKDILAGAGGVTSTTNMLNTLKAQRATATDPALIAILDSAIAKVSARLDTRKFVAAQEKAADKIVASNKPTAQKIKELEGIEKSLHGKSKVAIDHVAAEVDSLKPHIDALKGVPFLTPTQRQSAIRQSALGTTDPSVKGPHAAGLLGFTGGATNIGVAGEAGTEAVAIIRNPKPLTRGGGEVTLNVNVTVSGHASLASPGTVREMAQQLGPAIVLWMQRNGILARTGSPLRG